MQFSKKLLHAATMIVIIVFTAELTALTAYYFAWGKFISFAELSAARAKLTQTTDSADAKEAPAKILEGRLYVMHPYYGYSAIPRPVGGVSNINIGGFADNNDPLAPRSKDKVRIGVIGGSVAYFVSAEGRQTLQEAASKIPLFRGKTIEIVSLALGGFKQPQSLSVVLDLLARGAGYDVVIAVDGFNEVALGININRLVNVDPFFPQGWREMAGELSDRGQIELLVLLREVEIRQKRSAQIFSEPILAWSATANFVWSVLDNRLANERVAAQARLQSQPSDAAHAEQIAAVRVINGRASAGYPFRWKSAREYYADLSLHWARSHVMLQNAVVSQGGLYFHFLQPNQYFAGSKPLSSEEVKMLLSHHPQSWNVNVGYPYLRSVGALLAAQGLEFHDLTELFVNTTETVYRDSCCHFTIAGSQAIASEIMKTVAKSIEQNGETQVPVSLARIEPLGTGANDVFAPEQLRRHSPQPDKFIDGSSIFMSGNSINDFAYWDKQEAPSRDVGDAVDVFPSIPGFSAFSQRTSADVTVDFPIGVATDSALGQIKPARGKLTSTIYIADTNRSSSEVLTELDRAGQSHGFTKLFACASDGCGRAFRTEYLQKQEDNLLPEGFSEATRLSVRKFISNKATSFVFNLYRRPGALVTLITLSAEGREGYLLQILETPAG